MLGTRVIIARGSRLVDSADRLLERARRWVNGGGVSGPNETPAERDDRPKGKGRRVAHQESGSSAVGYVRSK